MHIITYLLIFTTNKLYEGQSFAERSVEALYTKHVGMVKSVNSKFIPSYFIVLYISYVFYCFYFLCISLFYDFFFCNLILINFKI